MVTPLLSKHFYCISGIQWYPVSSPIARISAAWKSNGILAECRQSRCREQQNTKRVHSKPMRDFSQDRLSPHPLIFLPNHAAKHACTEHAHKLPALCRRICPWSCMIKENILGLSWSLQAPPPEFPGIPSRLPPLSPDLHWLSFRPVRGFWLLNWPWPLSFSVEVPDQKFPLPNFFFLSKKALLVTFLHVRRTEMERFPFFVMIL